MNDSPSCVWYLRPHLAFAACRVLSLPIITAYRGKMPVELCNGGIAIHMVSVLLLSIDLLLCLLPLVNS